MADGAPIRLRAREEGGRTEVRVLMAHEMESGRRRDGDGRLVPAWHIHEVVATLNGRPVLTARFGPAVSRNPFLRFALRGAQRGDRVGIAWVDNRGDSRSAETIVT